MTGVFFSSVIVNRSDPGLGPGERALGIQRETRARHAFTGGGDFSLSSSLREKGQGEGRPLAPTLAAHVCLTSDHSVHEQPEHVVAKGQERARAVMSMLHRKMVRGMPTRLAWAET